MIVFTMANFFRGNVLLKNSGFVDSNLLPARQNQALYEVIRIIDDVPFFWRAHFNRLQNSAKLAGVVLQLSEKQFIFNLKKLITHCKHGVGNIRVLIVLNEKEQDSYFYFVPHSYPSENDYKYGVELGLLHAERIQPQAKIIQEKLRTKANQLILEEGFHEVLLVNQDDLITEGSRSNIFFVKENVFITPPAAQVLKGVTRTGVIQCLQKLNYKIEEREVAVKDLTSFDSAFLTGTSPKVLPVSQVENIQFNVNNDLVRRLMLELDEMINVNIEQNRQLFRL